MNAAQKLISAHLVSGDLTPGGEIAIRIDPVSYTHLVYKVGKAAREGARLTGACAGHDADVALRRSDRLALTAVQAFQNIHAIAPFGISIPFRGSRVQKARRFCAGPFRMCLV